MNRPDESETGGGELVTLEGIDGAGKSTVVARLAERFPDATVTREPSEGWFGERVTEAVEGDLGGALSDLFLFMADHADHLERVVRPALADGDLVICDRYVDSRVAYQAVDVTHVEDPMSWIRGLHEGWSVDPDRTVLLDVPVEVAVDRLEDDRAKFEHREHLEAVHENYRRIAEAEGRVTVVDAARPVEDVVDDVAAVVADTERSGGASSRG